MFQFEEVELNICDRKEESSSNNSIFSIFDKINAGCNNLLALNTDLLNLIKTSQLDLCDNLISDMDEENNKIYNLINRLSMECGIGKNVSLPLPDKRADVTVVYDNDVLQITFDRLLPKKTNDKITTQDRNRILSEFLEGFYEDSSKVQHLFTEPVTLFFLNHFSSQLHFIDHDNFIIKPFIDAICVNYLKDDNPQYCSLYMDAILDPGFDFSEIYVIPDSLFDALLWLWGRLAATALI